jgi:hypothetical protein
MQTCSNCGATSREGAKFCTTCGSRLNPVVDASNTSGWESYAPADETQVATAVTGEDAAPPREETPVEAVEPEWASTEEPATTTTWSWGQSVVDEPDVVEEAPAEAEAQSAPPADDNESLSSWANQWDAPAESPAEIDAAAPVNTEAEFEPAPDAVEDEPVEQQVATAEEVQDEPSALFGAVPESAPGDSPSPKERAQALLFELRELIDESFAESSVHFNADGTGDSGSALETLNALGDDAGQFDQLRAILEKAREHPRDVDTMLNLLGEINSLIDLVDRYHAYVTAVDEARRQLS